MRELEVVSKVRAIPSIRWGFCVVIWNFDTVSPGIAFQRKTLIPDNPVKICELMSISDSISPIPCPVVAKLVILIGVAGVAILGSFFVITSSISRAIVDCKRGKTLLR